MLTQSNFQQSTLPWGSIDPTSCPGTSSETDADQIRNNLKLPDDKKPFYQLFLRNYQQIVETFSWFIGKAFFDSDSTFGILVQYFCQDNKTIPFPSDWRIRQGETQSFLNPASSSTKFTFQHWNNSLQKLSIDQIGEDSNIAQFLSARENNAFEEIFFKAYLYFVRLAKVQLYSDSGFVAFLENIKTWITQLYAEILINFQKAHWLGFLPGTDLKSLGTNKIDLTPILNLDPNRLNLDTLSLQQNNFLIKDLSKSRPYTLELKHPWNQPYKMIIDVFTKLLNDITFWLELDSIFNSNFGIKVLFLNNQEYSLKNLSNFWKLNDMNNNENRSFSFLNSPSRVELTKLVFANKKGIKQGVDSPAKLQKLFVATKTKLLTDLKTALDQLVAFDSTITQLTIKGQKYNLDQLLPARDKLLNANFETEETGATAQIKALFSNQIYAADIIENINSASSRIRNKNLAIGLGTAGGVVALAGASGFAYWFIKTRKS